MAQAHGRSIGQVCAADLNHVIEFCRLAPQRVVQFLKRRHKVVFDRQTRGAV